MKSHRLAGMAAMLAGVASFSFMDAGLKLLPAHYPAMQVAALRGLAALPLVFAWAMYAGRAAAAGERALAFAPDSRRSVGDHDGDVYLRHEVAVAGQDVRDCSSLHPC